ncbi:MAG: NB-ARC domain-containing protein [Anaerolineae bacterium]
MTQPSPDKNVGAHIQGEISGQVAVGNCNIQIGAIHGGVVNIAPPEQQPRPRPRPTPVFLRPRPFPGLLDREAEVDAATAALQSALPVEFYGQPGSGKTTLLRYLSHHRAATSFPDGVVYLSARHQSVADLLQSLFDAFYESDTPFKPTDAQARHALQGKQALILLDDVELAWDEVEALIDAAPGCTFLLASPERRLWGEGRAVALHGLPPDDSLALVERELGRPLTSEERPAAQALCTALDGHPLHLIQATALAREAGCPLGEVARQVQSASPSQALMVQVLASLSEPEKRILAVLATLDGAPLSTEHLAALTGLADAAPVLETLQRRGLVQTESPRYSLTGTLGEYLQQTWDLTPLAEQALTHFTAWAEQHRSAPDRLLEAADAILQVLGLGSNAGRWVEVLHLGQAVEDALALGRRWDAWAQVLQWGLQAARALQDRAAEAWALHQLGTRALCLGDTATARTSLIKALRLRESLGDRIGAAVTRHNLDHLVGPPPPPRRPPQPPETPSPTGPAAPVAPLLSKEIVILLSALLLVLGGLVGVWSFWPTAAPTTTPTSTPIPTAKLTNTPTTTPTNTPTPTSTPDLQGPPAPQLLAPEQKARISCAPDEKEQQIRLQWATVSDPSGIQSYEVHLEAIERTPYTYPPQFFREPFVDIRVPCDETYLWRVRAIDRAWNAGAWSEERVFSAVDTTKPLAPKLLEPEDGAEIPCTADPTRVTLRWSAVEDPSGIVGYLIQLEAVVYTTPTGPTPVPIYVGPVKRTAFEIFLNCGRDYGWRVQAVDGAGNTGVWSEERVFSVTDKTGLPSPTLLEPQDGAEIPCPTGQSASVTLRWSRVTAPSGIARYDVELAKTPEYPPVPITSTLQIEGSQQTIISSRCGDSYDWRVRAVDGSGDVGEWSVSWHFRVLTLQETDQTPPEAPTPLEPGTLYENQPAVLESCAQVVLRWEAASDDPNGSGIQDYRVNLQRHDDGTWKSIEPYFYIYKTSIDVAEWLSIGRYRWGVWARDKAGNQGDTSAWLYFECPDQIPPPIPTPLKPGRANSTDPEKDVKCPVTLIWAAVFDPSGVVYEVLLEKRGEPGVGWKEAGRWYPVFSSELEVSYPQCKEKTEYRWRVRAQDGAENWSGWPPKWLYYTTAPD